MHALIIALVVLIACALPTLSTHFTCSWQDQGTPAEEFGYKLWCVSILNKQRGYKATYDCRGVTVADFGMLKPDVLEIHTPCGKHGFADDCDWDVWGACIDDKHCLFLGEKDDCEWPDKFSSKYLPRTVAIWHKISAHNLTREEQGRGLVDA